MKTIDLIAKAEQAGLSLAQLSRDAGVHENTLSSAKNLGHVSPEMTVTLAHKLGENIGTWVVVSLTEKATKPALKRSLSSIAREMTNS